MVFSKIAVAVLLLAAWPVAQTVPLPTQMHSAFGAGQRAATLRPPTLPGDFAEAGLTFSSEGRSVILDWSYSSSGGDVLSKLDEQTTSFLPTAVCVEAGETLSFFVAGYSPRSELIVVERWTLSGLALATTLTPAGVPLTSLSYSIQKSAVATLADHAFVRSMVYSLYQDRLLLFSENGTEVWSLDVASGALELAMDAQTVPHLADCRSFNATVIDVAAAEPGFLTVGMPWRCWAPGQLPDGSTFDKALILRDEDLDGVFDEVTALTWAEFRQRGYIEHEVVDYTL